VAGGAGGDEAAWRDLIANYATDPGTGGGEVPWPERENLGRPREGGPPADPGPDTDPALMLDLSDDTDPALDLGDDFGSDAGPGPGPGRPPGAGPAPGSGPPPGAEGCRGADGCAGAEGVTGTEAGPGTDAYPGTRRPGPVRPDGVSPGQDRDRPGPGQDAAGRPPGTSGRGTHRDGGRARIIRPARRIPPAPSGPPGEDNFVPPEPPPLPPLSPTTKGAWAALFGGPGYLLIATVAGWAVPGWAAFLAIAAFIGGFTVLVIQMGDRPPRDSGPDDGAVV